MKPNYCSWCRGFAALEKKIWMGRIINLCGDCCKKYNKTKRDMKKAKIKVGTDYVVRR